MTFELRSADFAPGAEIPQRFTCDLPAGTRVALNDWKRIRCGGPCPPVGRQPTKPELERAMRGRILAQAELIGTYERAAPHSSRSRG